MRLWRSLLLSVSGGLALFLTMGLTSGIPAKAAAVAAVDSQTTPSVPVSPVSAGGQGFAPLPDSVSQPPLWPTPGAVEVDLPASKMRSLAETATVTANVGGLKVDVKGLAPAVDDLKSSTSLELPSKVRVEVLDRAVAQKAGYPMALRVSSADGKESGRVQIDVSYASFRHAFGADWDARLGLVMLQGCALTTPDEGTCRKAIPLVTSNNHRDGVLTAEVSLDGRRPGTSALAIPVEKADPNAPATDGGVTLEGGGTGTGGDSTILALAAVASAADGSDFGKTDLEPTGSWQAGDSGGGFSWNYPMPAPVMPGGLTPDLNLSYSSASVDGKTSGKNVQAEWGEGWNYNPGSIERSYRACAEDTANNPYWSIPTSDLCWRLPNAHLTLGGKSMELILGDDGKWRAEDDDVAKIEWLTGGSSTGYYLNEKWKVTTTDGTQYFFGLNQLPGFQAGDRETSSVLGAPVYANHSSEPCFNSTDVFLSGCGLAYRWNLDYVIDPQGNTMSYWYMKEWNKTALNGDPNRIAWYERSSMLGRIEYGTRAGSGATRESLPTATPPAQVVFVRGDRCLTTSCATHDRANWPDVPWDMECLGTNCANNISPSFWTTSYTRAVVTMVWSGSGSTYNWVDAWDMKYLFPDTGSGLAPALWLEKLTHTGHVGGTLATPDTVFYGAKANNRADWNPQGTMAAHWKYRITGIANQAGGQTLVTYSDPSQSANCQFGGTFPTPDNNSSLCFPKWYTNPSGGSGFSWWHKLMVTKVVERDTTGGGPDIEHNYSYSTEGSSTPVLWTHEDGASVWATPGTRRSYNDWRGYPTVTVTTGPAGNQSKTKTLYFRGLDQSMTEAGGEFGRTATITNSLGEVSADSKQFAGTAHELQTFNGAQVIEKDITDPVRFQTSSRVLPSTWAWPTTFKGYITRTAKNRHLTYVTATSSWRTTQQTSSWDPAWGLLTQVTNSGDTAVSGDETCSYTAYGSSSGWNPNQTLWLINYPSQVTTTNCAGSPAAGDYLSGTQYLYDGSTTVGATVNRGDLTGTNQLLTSETGWWPQATRTTYDGYGRLLDSFDALNRKTMTRYTDSAGRLATVTVTNPASHVTTTTVDARGLALTITDANNKVTTGSYDPLGRLVKLWKNRAITGTPDTEYTYAVQNTAASYIRTRVLGPNANQIDSYDIFDSLLRDRQTQATAPDGKRTITDTIYDGSGNVAKTATFYNNASGPAGTLVTAADSAIDKRQVFTYDGAGRQITAADYQKTSLLTTTTTIYGGDRTSVIPPTGRTTTQDIVDARGLVMEKRQFATTDLGGAFDKTLYEYDREGQLTKVTGPANSQWTYSYDTLGRKTQATDPDTGTSTLTYDLAGQTTSSKDARNQQLWFEYDNLGRKTKTRADSATGTVLSSALFDTVAKGQLTSSTRHDATGDFTTSVGSYDNGYRPLSTTATAPGFGDGGTVLTYVTTNVYKANGALESQSLPAAGGLPAEKLITTYSDAGMPTSLASQEGTTYLSGTTHQYDGAVAEMFLGAAGKRVRISSTYDPSTRRLSTRDIATETSPNTWASKTADAYTYDQAGNVTAIAGTTNSVADQEQCFRYDNLRRLTDAWTQVSGACATPQKTGADAYWRAWSIDKEGNRLTQTDKNADGTTGTSWNYQVGAAGSVKTHQLKKVDATGPLSGTPTRTFAYDTAGNTTSRTSETGTSQQLTWDKENRLSKVEEGAGNTVASYIYKPDGSRLVGTAKSGTATTTTLYLPDGTELEKTSTGGANLATRYIAGVAVRNATGLTWMVTNYQNTGIIQIDAQTLAVTIRRMMPYGETRGTPPAWTGTKGYVGGTSDKPTGLTHLGAREYDPSTGRFISRDPIVDFKDPQQIHGYAYTNNSPITFSDPTGLALDEVLNGSMTPSQAASYNPNYTYYQQAKVRVAIQARQAAQRRADAARVTRAVIKDATSTLNESRDAANKILTGIAAERLKARDLTRHATTRQAIDQGIKTGQLVKKYPIIKTIGEWSKNGWVKGLGKATVVAGFGIATFGYLNEGDDGATAVAKAGLETGFSAAGGIAGAFVGGFCGPAAVVCVPFGTAAGGYLAGKGGEWVNGELESGAFFGFKPYESTDSWFDWD